MSMRSHDDQSGRAVWRAARRGDFGKLRALLSAASDPRALANYFHPTAGVTPLMAAARKRSGGPAVQALIEYGAELDLVDQTKRRNTALHYAAYANRVTQVDFLLHAGASPLVLNRSGHSALDVARLRGRKEAAAALAAALSIHSGWLYVRSQAILPIWRRRWCVMVACNADRSVRELCVFQDPTTAHPEYILQMDQPVEAMLYSASANGDSLWMDRANAFKLSKPVHYQRVRRHRYRRDPVTGRTQGYGMTSSLDYVFAADTETDREAWMQVMEGRPIELFPLPRPHPSEIALTVTVFPVSDMEMSRESPRVRSATFSAEPEQSASFNEVSMEMVGSSAPGLSSKLSSRSLESPPFRELSMRASAPTFIDDEVELFPLPTSSGRSSSNDASAEASRDQRSSSATDFAQPGTLSARDCVVCMDAPRDAICVPCGHIAGCFSCLRTIVQASSECPICRAHVDTVVRVYDC
jgi:hypothetical protein